MSIKVGSRIFAPRAFTTLLTIVLIVLLISLGRWQLRRADEKRALFESFAAGTDATRLIDLGTPRLRRYQQIAASGHYDQSRQILIDNMVNAERSLFIVSAWSAMRTGDINLFIVDFFTARPRLEREREQPPLDALYQVWLQGYR